MTKLVKSASKYFKKADLLLLAAILLLSAAGFAVLRSSANENSMIEISIAGEIRERKPLSADSVYYIRSEYGYNIINVEGGQVWISEADCRGGDCVSFGKISSEGQIILCLPHKLAVRITGGETENDAISY